MEKNYWNIIERFLGKRKTLYNLNLRMYYMCLLNMGDTHVSSGRLLFLVKSSMGRISEPAKL